MANEEHVKILKKGVTAWNQWRKRNHKIQPNFSGMDLSWESFSGANLRGANLAGADLSGAELNATHFEGALLRDAHLGAAQLTAAYLTGADLGEANLIGADLSAAELNEANLSRANLSLANLSEADLRGANLDSVLLNEANLRGANLAGADLSGAELWETMFADVDLREVRGLENIIHKGPSHVSISTIYRSQGKIPFGFLRGTGVPENFIEYMHSLTGTAFEFYSCFISYSSKDQEFAERLFADLQAKGVRCWFAPHHGQAGQKLHLQIDEAIRLHEKLLLILSADSMKSEWVRTEIKKAARRQARDKQDVLFPVSLVSFAKLRKWECFDSDLGKDLGCEVREYLIPDFSHWKNHDSYQKAFAKLLKDLRSGRTKTAAVSL